MSKKDRTGGSGSDGRQHQGGGRRGGKKRMVKKATKKRGTKKSAKKSSKKKASKKKGAKKKIGKKGASKKGARASSKKASKKTRKRGASMVHTQGGRGRKKTVKKVARRGKGARVISGKMVYSFGARTEGDGSMRELLGGKGANLAEMTSIGLPVPAGFTITTEACAQYYSSGRRVPKKLMGEVRDQLSRLEKQRGKVLGDPGDPLLVSVRSGAAVSMPGMMDTILNLGLNDESVEGLARATGNERFAFDAYRRLINMFGEVVMGISHEHFEEAFGALKRGVGARLDTDVSASGLRDLCARYKGVFEERGGRAFPQDPMEQLALAIEAVFASWMSDKAVSYRRIEGVTGLTGTAVNVQSMVYGNMGEDSGTGVAFTRNPSTGENRFYGEFLVNAQGEDVVAGIRTPRPVSEMKSWNKDAHGRLMEIKGILERHYRDVQDIEFTIECGELFMLQTRTGKRTGAASVKIAVDMEREGLISRDEALLRVPASGLTQLLLPSFDPYAKQDADVLTRGLPASPGASVGHPAFTADEAVDRANSGEKVILVRRETSPEDVDGMHRAEGILTSTGGMTSHAAVVARGWGKCCVAGAGEVEIDEGRGEFVVGGRRFGRGDLISIDGGTGEVMSGSVDRVEPELGGDFAKLMRWADARRTMGVRANADSPEDALKARALGAKGIGLCRTEHMFFDGDRIGAMRAMILAEDRSAREEALSELLPLQRADFEGIFEAMKGYPVTVRLLDPPLHEFLPHDPGAMREMADRMGVGVLEVERRVLLLREANPMMGHRGCRLAVTYPEILRMQVRAIVEAAIGCAKRRVRAVPEIMVPLVGTARELGYLRGLIELEIEAVRREHKHRGKLSISIGTMIEIPRAAVTAEEIAAHADFFSFGTNDLTQMAFGYSRDDVNGFLPEYLRMEILDGDPFASIDVGGVGRLVEVAAREGRGVKGDLKLGVCGEHGGDPESVRFFRGCGLDYVSCSTFRVPIARLAAAQAEILSEREKKGRS